MTSRSDLVIHATVTIKDIDPPIWRSLLLPTTLNLAELHHILQAAFGWHDAHLHEFIIGGLAYGAPEFAREGFEGEPRMFEATEVRLRDFDLYHVPHPSFLYHYDFGDSWMHLVTFETLVANELAARYPACTGGARHDHPKTLAGPTAMPTSSRPGVILCTTSTRPCAAGRDELSTRRSSTRMRPTKLFGPPRARPAVTTFSDASDQSLTSLVAVSR